MKKRTNLCLLIACLFVNTGLLWSQKVKFEDVKEQCANLDYAKRVRLTVSSFQVSTPKASGQFGSELAEMLSNALQNVNCFNVLLSAKNSQELIEEAAFEQSGTTSASSAVKSGKMKGAQVIVMGKVTEYAEGNSSTSAFGLSVGGNKAHIGFVIQLVNAETREIIESKSIDVDGKSNGFSGFKVLGLRMVGSVQNKAVADACEKGIIEAIEFIASRRDKMPLPEGNSGVVQAKVFNASNCNLLKSGTAPKIMVILPEFHISRRLPDPAGETEIIRQFVEAGFPVVDAAMYASLRGTAKFDEAAKDPMKAISLGKEFGANIVIYGEAFSQLVNTMPGGQVSCRARVEAKAVKTDDATIIATNGLEAGALDNAEFVAAKSALRNAGQLLSEYLLEQFCTKSLSFAKATSVGSAGSGSNMTITEISIKNADYSKLKPLLDLLATKGKVLDKSASDGTGYVKFEHAASVDLTDLIDSKLGTKYTITDFSSGKLTLQTK